jgi:anion-transporting  ArsA/GET3 family ATPase
MISLKRLFLPMSAPRDGLTQRQREAIVDLLNYCSFIDRDIVQSESELIDDLERQFHWDANVDFDYYVNKSVDAVRNVLENKDSAGEFLANIRARLSSKKSRAIALGLADKIVKTDGRVTAAESETYQAIRKALG